MSRTNEPPPYNPADDEFDMIEAAGFDPTDPEQVEAYRRQAQAARDEEAIDRYLDRWEAIDRYLDRWEDIEQ